MKFKFNQEVAYALKNNQPIVALESTVIAHGLPYPNNIEVAHKLENIVRENGAVPATIAVFDGEFCVGLDESQLNRLATEKDIRKISRRDLPIAVAKKLNCATTVATTMFIAYRAGIKVFATGGIGGVHRGNLPDISADLPELATTPMTVVCAGAKIVLDLPSTREWLETNGVCILGWQCEEMPAFYSRKSGLKVDEKVETAEDVAQIIKSRDELKMPNAILLTAPVPEEFEISSEKLDSILQSALSEADANNILGKEITPFLLAKMSAESKGETLRTNIALLENNAKIAAQVAVKVIGDE
ncbi:MAG: pseudouridine-5'-phosphate glycosidase [Acidobacteriota bacterium]